MVRNVGGGVVLCVPSEWGSGVSIHPPSPDVEQYENDVERWDGEAHAASEP